MKKLNSNYKFDSMISILHKLDINHSSSRLNELKNELNKFFTGAKCREVLYTNNTDKLFFGMRVYPAIEGNTVMDILHNNKAVSYDAYYVEIDSKLLDPMLALSGRELTAILLHEVGHIVYDTQPTDEVKKHIDKYLVNSDSYINLKESINYRELLAYALKDSVMKCASLFSKLGNDEMIADAFVASCGFGPDLESGFRKINRSAMFINDAVDNKFITLAWVLRIYAEINTKRLPAIKTLNKAKTLTGSQLEKRELTNAVMNLNRLTINEGALDNIKAKFNAKFAKIKAKGIRTLKDDVYEFNLRLRTIETQEEALLLIRNINNDICILEDYITEPDLPQSEVESISDLLQELYYIRQRAAKESKIRSNYDSMIKVVYPNM